MKNNHIVLYLVIIITFAVVGNSMKPNAFKVRKFGAEEATTSQSQFLDKVNKHTKEVLEEPNAEISLEISLAMQDFKKHFPSEFAEIVKEKNSLDLANKLKSNKNFKKIAKERNLDLSKVKFVEKI